MNLERLIGLEHYLNAETIKAYYEEGVVTAPVAIRMYLLGRLKFECWESKKTMSQKLGIPYPAFKRACKNLKDEGFAWQDRSKSKVQSDGKTWYRRVWHLGSASSNPDSGKGLKTNLLGYDKGLKTNLPDSQKGLKTNLLGVTFSPLQGSQGTKNEPHTLEYSCEKKKVDHNPIVIVPEKSGAIGTMGVVPIPAKSETESEAEYLNRGPDGSPVNVPPAPPAPPAPPSPNNAANPANPVTLKPASTESDKKISESCIRKYYTEQDNKTITASMRAQQYYQPWHSFTEADNSSPNAHIENIAHAFNDMLKAVGFHSWAHDEAKDIATAWAIYKAIHPTWRNKEDILSLLFVNTRYILSRARQGTFVTEDLWLNSFKDRIDGIWKPATREKPRNQKWEDAVTKSVRFLLTPDPQQA